MGVRGILFCSAAIFACVSLAWGQEVTPSDRVTTHVNVRAEPMGSAAITGELRAGERAVLLASVPFWHKVRLTDGVEGFVSKAWTVVLTTPGEVPFQIHFLDVGTGDSAIIDVGENEIVIDGGDSERVLHDYAARTGVIDGSIELLIITHADTDHWKGARRLLNLDGRATEPRTAREIWEPGYNRNCQPASNGGRQSYLRFISGLEDLPGIQLRRPLEDFHPPAMATSTLDTLRPVPGVSVIILHSDKAPQGSDCSYRINNASIVLKLEVSGVRFLFTGDANGKERDEDSPGTPGHVEAQLLVLEQTFPGLLQADVLKVPHHGSETASTQAFINAVDPAFVVISASTRHHLPRATVVERYTNGQRVILRTDTNRESDRDHILCFKAEGELECNYEDVLEE